MNKISKKIVALATMAAFVLTLVPAAAFAAPSSVDTGKSSVQTEEENTEVKTGDRVNYKLNLLDSNGAGLDAQAVYIWVEDAETHEVLGENDVVYYNDDKTSTPSPAAKYLGSTYVFETTQSNNGAWRSLVIDEAGDYVIKAGVVKDDGLAIDSIDDLVKLDNNGKNVTKWNTISVVTPDVATIALTDEDGTPLPAWNAQNGTTLDLTNPEYLDDFVPSGSDRYHLHGIAYADKEQTKAIPNEVFTVSTNKTDIVEFYGDADTETEGYQVKTNSEGEFVIEFSMNPFSNANLTITGEDGEYYVRIIAEKTSADDINRTLENGYVLAGNNTNPAWSTAYAMFTDAVQFEILDQKEKAVTGEDAIANEPANEAIAKSDPTEHAKYVSLMTWPEKSKVQPSDFALAWDKTQGVYTLKFTGDADRAKEVLLPGKYTVRVSLLSNDNATVSFNVAKFGTVENLEVSLYADDQSAQARIPVALDDEVTLGQEVQAIARYVDGNGLKVFAPDVTVAATGEAVVDSKTAQGLLKFTTQPDIPANESLLGTTVKVMAWNTDKAQYIERELNVVKSYNDLALEFDSTEGPVNEDNTVNVTVVKENGDKAQVYGTLEAFVVDQSNEDAKVTIEGANKSDVKNGKGSFTIYSTEETTVDVRVIVKDRSNDGAYAATFEYTVGKEDPLANRSVVMTIGSTDYVVNNNIVDGDAAPYIDSNWRTMVPIRALMESFDAEVVWSEADPDVVTINYDGGTQIIMNVGEETYTINGVEGEMDTVPVNNNGRVYVPVRFVAEGIGFSVTPLYDAETGLTASVVFQK